MMHINKVCAGYGQTPVLSDISAKAEPGQLVALVGPNGCGKSTLIKTICGLISQTSGRINWNGNDIKILPKRQRARSLSYLSQHREAMPGMLVSDIVALGRAPFRGRLGRLSHEDIEAVERASEVCQITPYLTRPFQTLSGGEQARVLLARALSVNAPVLLLDEPIAALDPFYQLTIMEILKSEALSGRLIIAALHDLALTQQFADKVWVMNEGEIVSDDTPQATFKSAIYETVFGIRVPSAGFPKMELSKID